MEPKIQVRKNSEGKYEAFHILTKTSGRKMKIFEVAPTKPEAISNLKSLLRPMFMEETAYKLITNEQNSKNNNTEKLVIWEVELYEGKPEEHSEPKQNEFYSKRNGEA